MLAEAEACLKDLNVKNEQAEEITVPTTIAAAKIVRLLQILVLIFPRNVSKIPFQMIFNRIVFEHKSTFK